MYIFVIHRTAMAHLLRPFICSQMLDKIDLYCIFNRLSAVTFPQSLEFLFIHTVRTQAVQYCYAVGHILQCVDNAHQCGLLLKVVSAL